ncbi:MAG: dimethyl sulfoxide reductase anchor subunit [Ahrensia sp.]|nr:dimethyl sulfoxide reductase anchor subunit [Ahrensia sp.]
MHPALSVIAFTVLSGAGYGLALVLALGHGNPAHLPTKFAWVTALVLIAVGLMSSTLHLGNPQRAWRAFSQWKTSWLSREGCMAVATFVPLTILAAMSILGDTFNLLLGYIGGIMCMITVYCTAMIYASLRTVPQWHTRWTPAVYLLFALTSGTMLYFAFFGREAGSDSNRIWVWLTLVFLVVTWAVKFMWLRHASAAGYGASSMESATGLGNLGRVRLLERPHAMENYLTREMAFRIARKHRERLSLIGAMLGAVLPFVLLVISLMVAPALGGFLQVVATISLLAGLFVERWLFFATAKHAVGLYYGGEEKLVPAE